MKKFFNDLGKNEVYKKLLKDPLPYVGGACLLAVLNTATFAIFGSGWGVTGALPYWGAWVLETIGVNVADWAYFASESAQKTLNNGFLMHGSSIRDIALIFGALVATLFASQFKFKKIKNAKQWVAAIVGGLLMGYGARLANGCNIGALFTSISALSLSGWIFAVFLLIGAYFGGKLLTKYLM